MATIQQRKDRDGKKVFDVVFSIREHQWKRTCFNKISATVSAKDVEARIEKVKLGTLKPPPNLSKKELGEWLWTGEVTTYSEVTTEPTMGELIEGYLLSSFYTEKADSTKRIEKMKCKHLLRLIGRNTILSKLNEAALQSYVDTRKTEKRFDGELVVGKTIKKELDVLRAIWNLYGLQQNLVNREWRSSFPKKIKLPKFSNKAPAKTMAECVDDFESVYLLGDEVKELLQHCKKRQKEVAEIYRWGYPAIAYCAYTSFRRSTMMTQEVSMVNFAKNELTGWIGKEDTSMVRTPRKVPMLEDLSSILKEWLDKGHVGGKLLFGCYPDVRITDSQAWHCWERYMKGSKFELIQGQWHILRHSFVSIAHMAGIPENAVVSFTGHHTEAVKRIYRHSAPGYLADTMKKLFA